MNLGQQPNRIEIGEKLDDTFAQCVRASISEQSIAWRQRLGTIVAAVGYKSEKEFLMSTMLKWALIMLVVSLIAALFGFTGLSAASADVARILFYVFIVIFLVLLVVGLFGGRGLRGP